jgi:ABC-type multidrug transport system fused ATPase/permease subunit
VLEELLRAGWNTIFIDIIMLIGITIAMFSIDPQLSLIIFITVPLFMVLVFILRVRLVNAARRIQRQYAAVNASSMSRFPASR